MEKIKVVGDSQYIFNDDHGSHVLFVVSQGFARAAGRLVVGLLGLICLFLFFTFPNASACAGSPASGCWFSRSCPPRSLVYPKRAAGAGVGIGILRGGGDSLD